MRRSLTYTHAPSIAQRTCVSIPIAQPTVGRSNIARRAVTSRRAFAALFGLILVFVRFFFADAADLDGDVE